MYSYTQENEKKREDIKTNPLVIEALNKVNFLCIVSLRTD